MIYISKNHLWDLTVAAVMTPRVPSEPRNSEVRLYPAALWNMEYLYTQLYLILIKLYPAALWNMVYWIILYPAALWNMEYLYTQLYLILIKLYPAALWNMVLYCKVGWGKIIGWGCKVVRFEVGCILPRSEMAKSRSQFLGPMRLCNVCLSFSSFLTLLGLLPLFYFVVVYILVYIFIFPNTLLGLLPLPAVWTTSPSARTTFDLFPAISRLQFIP